MSASKDAGPDRSTADIALVCTHKGELRPFLKRLDRQRSYTEGSLTVRGGFLRETIRIVVAEVGPGFARHRAAAHWLVETHKPAWMLAVGFSSSLTPEVHPGDLVLASEIVDTHGNTMPVKCTLKPGGRIHVGRLVVADSQPDDAAGKTALAHSSQALAVDTCCLAPAQICYERNVRFLAVRSIIDGPEESVPSASAGMVFRADSRSAGAALGGLLGRFSKASELNQWRQRGVAAAEHSDRFLAGVVEQIAELLERQRLDRS